VSVHPETIRARHGLADFQCPKRPRARSDLISLAVHFRCCSQLCTYIHGRWYHSLTHYTRRTWLGLVWPPTIDSPFRPLPFLVEERGSVVLPSPLLARGPWPISSTHPRRGGVAKKLATFRSLVFVLLCAVQVCLLLIIDRFISRCMLIPQSRILLRN
jgi:hypothetical protein